MSASDTRRAVARYLGDDREARILAAATEDERAEIQSLPPSPGRHVLLERLEAKQERQALDDLRARVDAIESRLGMYPSPPAPDKPGAASHEEIATLRAELDG